MAPHTPSDALTTDAGTLAQETARRPAFVVDADGAVVWAGPLARRLLDAGGLEQSSAATLSRLAASGAATMARLRFGALGRAAPLVVRTRPVALDEGRGLLAVEALSEIDPEIEAALEEALADEIDELSEPAPEPVVSQDDAARQVTDEPEPAEDEPKDEPVETVVQSVPETQAAERVDEPTSQAAPEPEAFDAPSDADLAALRFVFETDAGGRLVFLSPDLAAAVGRSAREAVGRHWSEIARTHGLDPEGAIERALGGTAGWSDLPACWPMPDGRSLPLSLSALPMFDRERKVVGFRGFGRATSAPAPLPTSEPEPAAGALEEWPATDDRLDETIAALEAVADVLTAADVAPERSTASTAAFEAADLAAREPEEAVVSDRPPVARLLGPNVVTLRNAAPPLLTTSEESAFDEIARRLRDVGVMTSATPYAEDAAPEPWMINDVETRVVVGARVDELLRMLDRLPVGALALKKGFVAYANRHALDLLGHPDLASLVERDPGTLFADPLPREHEASPSALKLVARNGAEVEAEGRLSSILWEGEPATLVSLKRAEGAGAAREAIEREKETAAILDTATDGVLTLDGAGRILSVNRSAEALFGFDAREVLGSLFTLSLAPESRKTAFEYLDRIRANGVAAVMNDGREVLALVRQGGAIPLYMTIGRIGAHEADRFCAVLRDITPWKKAEEELLAAKRQAERANAQKSEFLTKVSHEIRTPLNAIIGFAEVMMEERFGPVGSPRYKDYLRDIHVSGGHLVGLVDDLVDIARIESGGVKLDPTPVDLNEIAQQAAVLLQPQASREHVIIRASLGRAVPTVMADRRSVRQIMTALTANAVKLSRPGGQVIVATAVTDLGQAVIRVRDAGAGMSKQELASALEPFRPLGGGEGRGLALPLARALAEANEAVLTLSSEPGQGTLAEVTFPAARVLAS